LTLLELWRYIANERADLIKQIEKAKTGPSANLDVVMPQLTMEYTPKAAQVSGFIP
jgi:hypothetical protein